MKFEDFRRFSYIETLLKKKQEEPNGMVVQIFKDFLKNPDDSSELTLTQVIEDVDDFWDMFLKEKGHERVGLKELKEELAEAAQVQIGKSESSLRQFHNSITDQKVSEQGNI